MPASFLNLKSALSDLSLKKRLVLVHASPLVNADSLLTALLETTAGFFTPTFTPKSLLPLEYHPAHSKADVNSLAQPFTPSTSTDEAFGNFPELVRKHAKGKRSIHPVFSFAGINADSAMYAQTQDNLYAPIASLADEDGVILLVGWMAARMVRAILIGFTEAMGINDLAARLGITKILGGQRLSVLLGTLGYVITLIPVILAAIQALQIDSVSGPAVGALTNMFQSLPYVFASLLILGIAFLAGRVLKNFVAGILRGFGFDDILSAIGLTQTRTAVAGHRPSDIGGAVVMVFVMIFAAMEAAEILNFNNLASLISRFVEFMAQVVVAVVIIGIGFYLANFTRRVIRSNAADNEGDGEHLGALARALSGQPAHPRPEHVVQHERERLVRVEAFAVREIASERRAVAEQRVPLASDPEERHRGDRAGDAHPPRGHERAAVVRRGAFVRARVAPRHRRRHETGARRGHAPRGREERVRVGAPERASAHERRGRVQRRHDRAPHEHGGEHRRVAAPARGERSAHAFGFTAGRPSARLSATICPPCQRLCCTAPCSCT